MTEITAALVKELREKTGAGMMDCKKALIETGGDIEEATDWLRKKGLAAAAKKAGRLASEGLIGVTVDGKTGAVVEVNAETDFVARNETFQEYVKTVAGIAAESGSDLDALKAAAYPDAGRTVEEQITHLIATIGENMNLRRAAVLATESGIVGSYVHNALAPGLGKIGVLVSLHCENDSADLDSLGRQLAMHIAAANPQAVSREGLSPAVLDREREIFKDQARASGKPENIVEKMVEGRMRKFYEEACLLDQVWVIDGETRVSKVLGDAEKEAGAPVTVSDFARFALGEGIEKPQEDFAAEVAAAAGG
jgi:elongation factor Ts